MRGECTACHQDDELRTVYLREQSYPYQSYPVGRLCEPCRRLIGLHA